MIKITVKAPHGAGKTYCIGLIVEALKRAGIGGTARTSCDFHRWGDLPRVAIIEQHDTQND